MQAVARKRGRHLSAQPDPCYLERALLLWPRLDRAKLRKIADDPGRIAEMVVRRTSQPYDVILAMLLRQSPSFAKPTAEPRNLPTPRQEVSRVALRIVRNEDGDEIGVQNLPPL